MPYFRLNDLDVHYVEHGKGQPLVLLHGLLGSIESELRRFIPLLSEHYRVIAVDLRGHGQTGNSGKLSNALFRDDLIGLFDALRMESSLVFGYSLGGYVGLMAGLKRKGSIRALVMHATKMFWDKSSIEAVISRFDPQTILAKVPRYAELLQHVHGQDRWQILLSEAAAYMQTEAPLVSPLEEAICADFPVLVSVGDRDELVPIDEAARFCHGLPKGELLVMPSTRHAFDSVHEKIFVPAMLDFFKRA